MIALTLIPFYIAINIYIILRIQRWAGFLHIGFKKKPVKLLTTILFIIVAFSVATDFFLADGIIKSFFMKMGNLWFGILINSVFIIIVFEGIYRLSKRFKPEFIKKHRTDKAFFIVFTLGLVILIVASTYGTINAGIIQKKYYNVSINKNGGNTKNLRAVFIADTHLGYTNGINQIIKTVDAINSEEPDIVFIVGDIFDNRYEAILEPDKISNKLKAIKSKYGVYAVFGNHDVEEKVLAGFTFNNSNPKPSAEMYKFLENSNIRLLEDDVLLINNDFYVVGRNDEAVNKNRLSPYSLTKNLNKDKPIILLDHVPVNLDELSNFGFDLALSGHTHGGQIFPGNLIVGLFNDNPYGIKKYGNMISIVTSGIGAYGPLMRIGSSPEICIVNISFN